MQTINIHEAKTNLSRLIEKAVRGEPFIIAKAGKPLVKVSRLDTPSATQIKRVGFMNGQISVPDDFDRMGSEEIERLFESKA
ncbi:MAG: type II toxin-antitoxin system prevent-host-death family antitoxin [Deltaproteobacteria bacterium]|nr:type II toxin-antitoxin system prevent-host-death family antitoxin [Deltaproteobacteria bacterium]